MFDTLLRKDYTPLLASKNWAKVRDNLIMSSPIAAKDPIIAKNLAIVLENTRQALIADTRMTNLVYLPKVVLPLVKRFFPNTILNKIMSTQPLESATGFIRYLDAYSTDLSGNRTNIYPWGPNDTAYSENPKDVADDIISPAAGNTYVSFNGNLSALPSEGTLFIEIGDNSTSAASTSWTKVGEVNRGGVICQMGSVAVMGVVDLKTLKYVVNFGTAPVTAVRFTYKSNFEKNITFGSDQNMKKLEFSISSRPVETKSRKIGGSYSFELAEDYKNEHGEDFEKTLVDYMTTTMLTELDGEGIDLLFRKAANSGTWDATVPLTWSRGPSAWYETVMVAINKLSNTIYQNTHAAGASYIVCNPVTATVFQNMIQYRGGGNPTEGEMSVGAVKEGTLANTYNVYVTPLCPDKKLLLGFKDNRPDYCGAVYAPYVPVQLHPIYYSEGTPALMARSRYWMDVIRPDYYGVINVTGTI